MTTQSRYKNLEVNDIDICMFNGFFTSQSTIFSNAGTGLPWLNQYKARNDVSCSRTQRNDAEETRTRGLSVSSQALYHRATAIQTLYTYPGNELIARPIHERNTHPKVLRISSKRSKMQNGQTDKKRLPNIWPTNKIKK